MRKCGVFVGLVISLLVLINGLPLKADDPWFTMIEPIPGTFDVLLPKDQHSSTYQVFDALDQHMILDATGPDFAFSSTLRDLYRRQNRVPIDLPNGNMGIYDLVWHTTQEYPAYNPGNARFFYNDPAGWSADGKNMLYSAYDSDTVILYLALLTLDTGKWSRLAAFSMGHLIDTSLVPHVKPDLDLANVEVQRNPVYDTWLLMKITLYTPEDPATGGIDRSYHYSLWNYQTDQRIFFDDVFPDQQGEDRSFGWSDDGTLIQYATQTPTGRGFVINILHFKPQPATVMLLKQSQAGERGWISFLGINDLMITGNYDYQTHIDDDPTYLYTVSQIIDGTWYDRPIFRREKKLTYFKFTLTANEAEQHELSCLFDQALPTQLTAGNSTTTTISLPLMDEPNPASDQLASLPPQTSLTLTGEKACTDNIRWQHATLSDGTSGWVMEADRRHYYLAQE